jgi:hypothetical protein
MSSLDALDLSDAQYAAIEGASRLLHAADRDAFLAALAHRLRGEVIGDGSVGRAIRDLLATGAYRTQVHAAIGSSASGAAGERQRRASFARTIHNLTPCFKTTVENLGQTPNMINSSHGRGPATTHGRTP